jgi:hypothetical protein
MPDEAPDVQETPAPDTAAPDGTPAIESNDDSQPAPDTDWQNRYENLQPEYTRATQEASQLRQVFDLARQGDPQALEYLGLEPADTEDDVDDLDADEPLTRQEFESFLQQQQQAISEQQAQAELADLEAQYIDGEFKRLDPKGQFKDAYKQAVLRLAVDFEDEDGIPDLEEAHKALQGLFEENREQYIKSKRTPQVQSGASASHQPDLDDPDQRRAYMARRFADMQSVE